ncbi:hypothetical protein [Sinomicrobium sp. M5D2P17]
MEVNLINKLKRQDVLIFDDFRLKGLDHIKQTSLDGDHRRAGGFGKAPNSPSNFLIVCKARNESVLNSSNGIDVPLSPIDICETQLEEF